MTITLKYFGLIAEITNLKEETFSLGKENTSVSAFKSKIESTYPGLKNTTYSIAVNQTMAEFDYSLQDRDIIALLPPFAGG